MKGGLLPLANVFYLAAPSSSFSQNAAPQAGSSVRAPLMVIHEDGAKLLEEYEFIEKLVQSGEATWDNLSEDQVETMKAVLSILKDKAFFDKKKDGKEARGGDEDAM